METNIIYNLGSFFIEKIIKQDIFQIMIFNIKNLVIKSFRFILHINKICLYQFIYIKNDNRL